MNNKPKFSQALLNKIDSVHKTASAMFQSINPQALQLAPIKATQEVISTPRKFKR